MKKQIYYVVCNDIGS